MNTVTIVVIAIFAGLIIAGYFKGLIRVLLGTVMTIMSIAVAYVIAPMLSNFVCDNTNLDDYFEEKIYATVEAAVGDSVNNEVQGIVSDISDNVVNELPGNSKNAITDIAMQIEPTKSQQDEFVNELDIPEFAKKLIKENNNTETRKSLGVDNFYQFIAAYIARIIVNALTFLCVFVIFFIATRIIVVAAGVLSRLPIIGGVNKIGGAALGALEALILVWVLFFAVAVAINTDFGKEVYSQIEESAFLESLYNGNIFLPLVTKM